MLVTCPVSPALPIRFCCVMEFGTRAYKYRSRLARLVTDELKRNESMMIIGKHHTRQVKNLLLFLQLFLV